MTGREYITTRRIGRVGNGIGVNIPALWDEFKCGDVVNFKIYHIDRPENVIIVRKTIRNSNKKNSKTISCGDRSWGFSYGDMVVFSLSKVDDNDDTRVETQE